MMDESQDLMCLLLCHFLVGSLISKNFYHEFALIVVK
jgi:hypothetical protein